jgi:hypothetical protein
MDEAVAKIGALAQNQHQLAGSQHQFAENPQRSPANRQRHAEHPFA